MFQYNILYVVMIVDLPMQHATHLTILHFHFKF